MAGSPSRRSRTRTVPAGQRHVEHQHRSGLDVGHPGGRLAELHRAVAADQLGALVVDETDPDRVPADLGPPPAHPQHQVGAAVHRRKGRTQTCWKMPSTRELALLVDERVVGEDREVDVQLRPPGWR